MNLNAIKVLEAMSNALKGTMPSAGSVPRQSLSPGEALVAVSGAVHNLYIIPPMLSENYADFVRLLGECAAVAKAADIKAMDRRTESKSEAQLATILLTEHLMALLTLINTEVSKWPK